MKIRYSSPLLLLLALACLCFSEPASAQATYPPSVTITYQSLRSGTHTLRAFSGRRVRYAFPDSWLEGGGSQGLTPAELVSLIEKTDLLYELMADTLGGEPQGSGLMTVGVVPISGIEGGATGLAALGAKRCEISTVLLAATKAALAEGRLEETVVHEVAHTFDLYRAHMGYYTDSSHSWTEFWGHYSEYLQRTGPYRVAPDITFEATVYNFTRRWDALATPATWERCVKPGSVCEAEGVPANRAYSGLMLRYARLHGREALRRAFQFYKQYEAAADPVTAAFLPPEQKNDVFAEALSFGIQADVSGEFDAWFWPVSAAAREKLRRAYPQPNPFVTDADGDGWSPVRGDTDGHDPTVHPGAAETPDGRDDDGNGFVDDVTRAAGPALFTLPARLTGRLTPEQTDTFRFEATGALLIRTRADSWGGFVSIKREGEVIPSHRFGIGAGFSAISEFRLEGAGPWVLTVQAQSGTTGDYEIVIAPMPQGGVGAGEVFALPLRAPNSPREHTLVPGGMARAVGTLPGANAAQADARPGVQGRWPSILSGVEVRVGGLPARILALRRTGGDGYAVDFVVPAQVPHAASGSRVPVVMRHAASGAQWQLDGAELLEEAPVIWGRQVDGQSFPSALALESPTLAAFDEINRVPTGGDTRVMLFASGLGTGRTPDNTRLVAQLADGSRVQIPIEHVGATSLPGLRQLTFKVDAALSGQASVLLSVEGSEEVWVALHLR
jgi:uncharacterized protein (TIGR03437 family)